MCRPYIDTNNPQLVVRATSACASILFLIYLQMLQSTQFSNDFIIMDIISIVCKCLEMPLIELMID
jgi:hypothetical protein